MTDVHYHMADIIWLCYNSNTRTDWTQEISVKSTMQSFVSTVISYSVYFKWRHTQPSGRWISQPAQTTSSPGPINTQSFVHSSKILQIPCRYFLIFLISCIGSSDTSAGPLSTLWGILLHARLVKINSWVHNHCLGSVSGYNRASLLAALKGQSDWIFFFISQGIIITLI